MSFASPSCVVATHCLSCCSSSRNSSSSNISVQAEAGRGSQDGYFSVYQIYIIDTLNPASMLFCHLMLFTDRIRHIPERGGWRADGRGYAGQLLV